MTDNPLMAPEPETAEERHDRLNRLNEFRTSPVGVAMFYGYLLAILVTSFLVGKALIDNHKIASESHRGLCTLKAERHRRVVQTEEILKSKKPEDVQVVKALGRTLLVRSLATAKADENALKDVSC